MNLIFWAQMLGVGVAILVVAIVANAAATAVGLSTWYSFIEAIREDGPVTALRNERAASLLFLFLLYPLVLGLTGWAFSRWLA
jgi:hypothetical protein